jgi:poly(3-hydroxybutyrate) depolymerase
LQRLLARLLNEYDVDRHRIVVHGRQQAGGMAYLFGLASRDKVSGISVAAAATPRGLHIADAEPNTRVAVHSAQPQQFRFAASVNSGLRHLATAGYPVTTLTIESEQGHFNDEERRALLRWMDSLDRF